MDEKDSPMLQFWGTNFRRKQNDAYWVDKVNEQVQLFMTNNCERGLNELVYIVIPDVRFNNEVNYVVSSAKGYYVRVERFNSDGTRYIDPSRNPDHPSEVAIDDVRPHITLRATSGDLEELKRQTIQMLFELEKDNKR
jgi:hypothetical protein